MPPMPEAEGDTGAHQAAGGHQEGLGEQQGQHPTGRSLKKGTAPPLIAVAVDATIARSRRGL